jgi:hypothetical protein
MMYLHCEIILPRDECGGENDAGASLFFVAEGNATEAARKNARLL